MPLSKQERTALEQQLDAEQRFMQTLARFARMAGDPRLKEQLESSAARHEMRCAKLLHQLG